MSSAPAGAGRPRAYPPAPPRAAPALRGLASRRPAAPRAAHSHLTAPPAPPVPAEEEKKEEEEVDMGGGAGGLFGGGDDVRPSPRHARAAHAQTHTRTRTDGVLTPSLRSALLFRTGKLRVRARERGRPCGGG